MRVVFDTNVLISALVFPGGRADAAMHRIVDEIDLLITSRPLIDELLGVLASKFGRDPEELAHVAVYMSDLAITVHPRRRLHVVADDPDNRVLECAVTGRADVIVTGDGALIALQEYRGIRILRLRDYLES